MTKGEEGDVLYGVHDKDRPRLVPILGEELDRVAFLVVRDGGCYFIMSSGGGKGTSLYHRSRKKQEMCGTWTYCYLP
jgi:hypothetical protein